MKIDQQNSLKIMRLKYGSRIEAASVRRQSTRAGNTIRKSSPYVWRSAPVCCVSARLTRSLQKQADDVFEGGRVSRFKKRAAVVTVVLLGFGACVAATGFLAPAQPDELEVRV